jgi:hemophore-related protein
MPMMNRLIVGCSGLMLALIASSGIASAQPDVTAIANSTCTYPQVVAAMNAENPAAANQLSNSPLVTSWLQRLVASPPDGRRAMIAQAQTLPGFQPWTEFFNQVAGSCNNF